MPDVDALLHEQRHDVANVGRTSVYIYRDIRGLYLIVVIGFMRLTRRARSHCTMTTRRQVFVDHLSPIMRWGVDGKHKTILRKQREVTVSI